MLVLALDTSTVQLAAAWMRVEAGASIGSAESFAEISLPARPGHAERLLEHLGRLLETGGYRFPDVDLIAYGRGPGTFTGLRIGLATAKGLALSFGTPMVGVSTLEALAASAGRSGSVVPLIDARRRELYAAAYYVDAAVDPPALSTVLAERVVAAADLADLLDGTDRITDATFLGTGAARYASELAGRGTVLSSHAMAPRAVVLAKMGLRRFSACGGDDPARAQPEYLRAPDARLPGAAK